MAIPTMSSQQYNDLLENAQNEMLSINNKISTIKEDLQKKLSIIRYESEYTNYQISAINNMALTKDTKMKIFSRNGIGQYDTYGATVHPKFVKPPINIFNLNVSGSGEVFFRNDVKVAINDIAAEEYKNILKHDSVASKDILFQTFKQDTVKIEIISDTKNSLGDTKFNMIEIDSFLPGSFDIESIEVFNIDENGQLKETPITYSGLLKKGKERIIFNNKIKFHKIVFNIKLNYSTTNGIENIYPFGLKHLYFYDADFRTDSYVIATIQTEKPIAIIKDEIRIKTPFIDTTSDLSISSMSKEDIHLYIDNINGELETEIYASTPSQRNEIARNITTIFAKIPIVNRALIGIAFDVELKG